MRRALQLAARGQGHVEPNPLVGCVIVQRGRIVAEGWHRRFGGPHAEIDALRRCPPRRLRGATVYVTLEPCCHVGKTPPCADALIAAGVGRVVAALRDPYPLVAGGGLRRLRRAGIGVEVGVLGGAAAALNAPFIKLVTEHRPWVILKWAQSIDGRIATHTGDSKWISDERMRAHAHGVRGRVDAIVVGVHTVLRDAPALTCRDAPHRRVATRVVLDTHLRTPPGCRLVRTARRVPTWIVCAGGPLRGAAAARARVLADAGCVIHRVPLAAGRVALAALLDLFGRHEFTNVLVEGGGEVLGGFMDAGLADEVQIYVAPRLIGGARAIPALAGHGAACVRDAVTLPGARWQRRGSGWFVQARLHAND